MLDTNASARHRRPMRSRLASGLTLLAVSMVTLGCASDDPFLSLRDLCPELADDICNARNGGCCAPGDPVACAAQEQASCELQKSMYELESGRRYDAVAAAHARQAQHAALDACGPVAGLGVFFQDGLPVGTPCERFTQCASGACTGSPLTCTEVTPAALCAP
jgi:hypothetical protein